MPVFPFDMGVHWLRTDEQVLALVGRMFNEKGIGLKDLKAIGFGNTEADCILHSYYSLRLDIFRKIMSFLGGKVYLHGSKWDEELCVPLNGTSLKRLIAIYNYRYEANCIREFANTKSNVKKYTENIGKEGILCNTMFEILRVFGTKLKVVIDEYAVVEKQYVEKEPEAMLKAFTLQELSAEMIRRFQSELVDSDVNKFAWVKAVENIERAAMRTIIRRLENIGGSMLFEMNGSMYELEKNNLERMLEMKYLEAFKKKPLTKKAHWDSIVGHNSNLAQLYNFVDCKTKSEQFFAIMQKVGCHVYCSFGGKHAVEKIQKKTKRLRLVPETCNIDIRHWMAERLEIEQKRGYNAFFSSKSKMLLKVLRILCTRFGISIYLERGTKRYELDEMRRLACDACAIHGIEMGDLFKTVFKRANVRSTMLDAIGELQDYVLLAEYIGYSVWIE